MNLFHIVIIGSNETALFCAITAHKEYPDKNVALIINNNGNKFINRMFNSLLSDSKNEIKIIRDEVVLRKTSSLFLKSGDEIVFEKLVIASGSEAISPNIEGVEKDGVYFITKDPDQLLAIKNKALESDNIIVFGGGYTGVLLTDELLREGKRVTLVGRTNRLLPSSIDPEVSEETKKILETEGGRIIFKSKVKKVLGNRKISGVRLRDGEELNCDFLIICCGEKPNTDLAAKLGLVYDSDRGILVDEYQRTSDKNIFAIGECAARFDFFCGDLSNFILSTTRMEEAKLIGSNLYSVIYNRGRLIDYINEKEKFRKTIQKSINNPQRKRIEYLINSF
jgi:NADPH-dependent 2,4-dienoyl-CoA reductase/sulfur reductase-like enzyme